MMRPSELEQSKKKYPVAKSYREIGALKPRSYGSYSFRTSNLTQANPKNPSTDQPRNPTDTTSDGTRAILHVTIPSFSRQT